MCNAHDDDYVIPSAPDVNEGVTDFNRDFSEPGRLVEVKGNFPPAANWKEIGGFVDKPLENPSNPKDAEAQTKGKVRLDLLEPEGNRVTAEALAFGADKYGVENYVTVPIRFRVYLAAIERHIDALKRGEDVAEDSGIHHMGHIGANVHVFMAAMAAGQLVDDRGPGTLVRDNPDAQSINGNG